MARISVVNQFSAAGTVLPVGTTFSAVVLTDSFRDGRVVCEVSALGGSATLDTTIQLSADGTAWADLKTMDQATAVGNTIEPLTEAEISKFMRLKYLVAVDTVTLKSTLEAKEGD